MNLMKKPLVASLIAAAFCVPAFAQFHDNSRLYQTFTLAFKSLPAPVPVVDYCERFTQQTTDIGKLRASGMTRAKVLDMFTANPAMAAEHRAVVRTLIDVTYDAPANSLPQVTSAVNGTCTSAGSARNLTP